MLELARPPAVCGTSQFPAAALNNCLSCGFPGIGWNAKQGGGLRSSIKAKMTRHGPDESHGVTVGRNGCKETSVVAPVAKVVGGMNLRQAWRWRGIDPPNTDLGAALVTMLLR